MVNHENFDHRAVITWVRADAQPSASGWFYQTDSLGRKFATKNTLVASLARRYHERQWACVPYSFAGFGFRTLVGMKRADVPQDAA